MNSHMLRALGEMSKHGGNYFGQIHVEGMRQKRLQEAQVEAERIYQRNRVDKQADLESSRSYAEERQDTAREYAVEDRDANNEASLNQKRSLLEAEAEFKKQNPDFEKVIKGTNSEGKPVHYKVYSDGRMEETDIGVAPTGDPITADWKLKDVNRRELNGQTKDIKIQDAKEALDKMAHAYNGENAISDAAMIFYFMKTLDPTSVVRESEFRTVAEARGFMTEYEKSGKRIPAFLGQFMQRMDTGALLLPEQREQIVDESISAYNSKVSVLENITSTYDSLASNRGWDRESLGLQRWDAFKATNKESLLGNGSSKSSSVTSGGNHPADIQDILNAQKAGN